MSRKAGPPAEALRSGFEQLDHARAADGPRIIDFSAVEGDLDGIRAALDILADLPDELRGDVLVSALVGETETTGAVRTAITSLERRAERSITEVLDPLVASAPVEETGRPLTVGRAGVAGVALLAVASIVALGFTRVPSGEDLAQASPTTTAPAVLPPTAEAPVDLAALFTDPDRVIDVSLTADGLVVRRDPATRETIWQSGPYSDATAIRIDPNTVSVDRGDRGRLMISLVDGTQLPP